MFSKKREGKNAVISNSKKKSEVTNNNLKSTPTIISKDLKVEGDIVSAGLIEIEGIINGNINGNLVVIRESGFVNGSIMAKSLNIKGGVEGKVKAGQINIASKAKFVGTIEYNILSVEDGASIEGNFKQISS